MIAPGAGVAMQGWTLRGAVVEECVAGIWATQGAAASDSSSAATQSR